VSTDEPRWLTSEQEKAWIALVAAMTWLPAALDAQLQRDADISYVEYNVMSWLSMATGRTAKMSEIAVDANVTLSHLSRIAGRLERRGWLRRRPDPQDGRATLATLTEAGWRKVVDTAPGHVQQVQRLVFDNLSAAQIGQLQRIHEAIAHAARPDYPLQPTSAKSSSERTSGAA
jgi:DNA-binding MarR family transcriptional regulator